MSEETQSTDTSYIAGPLTILVQFNIFKVQLNDFCLRTINRPSFIVENETLRAMYIHLHVRFASESTPCDKPLTTDDFSTIYRLNKQQCIKSS